MIVVDASAVIEILLRPERHRLLLDRVLDPSQSLVAPHILDLEVTQVLRRYATGREISAARAEAAFEGVEKSCVPFSVNRGRGGGGRAARPRWRGRRGGRPSRARARRRD